MLQQNFDKSKIKDKYSLSGNTFKALKRHGVETSIGEGDGEVHIPNMTVSKWNGESNFKIKPQLSPTDRLNTTLKIEDNKIKYMSGNREYHFYDLDESEENINGGCEFEIILNTKPISNIITMDIETKGLRFLPQPALTPFEINNGCFRPEYIVDSYAIYHETKKNYIMGGTNYMNGKFLHIPRPKITDAIGNSVWGKLNINKISGTMSIEIPDAFMRSAICPIVVDPTMGYTTVGGTDSGLSEDFIFAMWKGTPASDGTAVSISIYCMVGSSTPITVGVYDDDAGGPNNLLRDSTEFNAANAGGAWETGTLDSGLSITNGSDYWLAQNHDDRAITFKYDSDLGRTVYLDPASYVSGTLVNPFPDGPTPVGNREYSIYLTYNVAGAGGPKSVFRGPFAGPFGGPI